MLTAEETRELEAIDTYLEPLDELMLQLHGLIGEYEEKVAASSAASHQDLAALRVELSDIEQDFQEAVAKAEADRIRKGMADL